MNVQQIYGEIPRQKMVRTEGLRSVLSSLRRIEGKIDSIVNRPNVEYPRRGPKKAVVIDKSFDVVTLLSFPDHLRKSAMTIMKLGRAMAEDVARETGRARAIESAYLNQLARMGYLKKGREGRRVYFSVEG